MKKSEEEESMKEEEEEEKVQAWQQYTWGYLFVSATFAPHVA
jgi:hypothetical protein